jgi:hypothetical protein
LRFADCVLRIDLLSFVVKNFLTTKDTKDTKDTTPIRNPQSAIRNHSRPFAAIFLTIYTELDKSDFCEKIVCVI